MTNKLLSHLAHIELGSPDVDASVKFYEKLFGLEVVDRDAQGSVYLRCWGDYYKYSLIVSPHPEPAVLNMAWRTASDEDLDIAAARIEAMGVEGVWHEPRQSHGRSYQFTGPQGHVMELYWEVTRHDSSANPSYNPDRPARRSLHAAAPRFLDHITVAAKDVRAFCEWYSEALGFRIMSYADLDHAPVTFFGVITTNEKSHDLGCLLDSSDIPGRTHHIAYWVDTHEDLTRTADVLMENGIEIEWGPSIHGIGEQIFLYFREPSGLRIELNSGGYRNYVPDWEPITWKPSQGSGTIYRNSDMPDSVVEAFPPDHSGKPTATEEGILSETEDDLVAGTIPRRV